MKHKKIIALLTAVTILASLAGCKAGSKKEQPSFPDGQSMPSFETQAPIESNASQAVGRVTSIDGTKITIENGELKTRTPGSGGNGGSGNSGNKKERPDKDGDNKKERPSDQARPSGDGKGSSRRGFGYTFNATGGSSTYDLSGLTQITIENDSDDTPDTIEEIKTGDVVVIEVDKDGKVTSLTVKSLSGGFGGNGKRTSSKDGDGNGSGKRKERGNKKSGKDNSDDQDPEA